MTRSARVRSSSSSPQTIRPQRSASASPGATQRRARAARRLGPRAPRRAPRRAASRARPPPRSGARRAPGRPRRGPAGCESGAERLAEGVYGVRLDQAELARVAEHVRQRVEVGAAGRHRAAVFSTEALRVPRLADPADRELVEAASPSVARSAASAPRMRFRSLLVVGARWRCPRRGSASRSRAASAPRVPPGTPASRCRPSPRRRRGQPRRRASRRSSAAPRRPPRRAGRCFCIASQRAPVGPSILGEGQFSMRKHLVSSLAAAGLLLAAPLSAAAGPLFSAMLSFQFAGLPPAIFRASARRARLRAICSPRSGRVVRRRFTTILPLTTAPPFSQLQVVVTKNDAASFAAGRPPAPSPRRRASSPSAAPRRAAPSDGPTLYARGRSWPCRTRGAWCKPRQDRPRAVAESQLAPPRAAVVSSGSDGRHRDSLPGSLRSDPLRVRPDDLDKEPLVYARGRAGRSRGAPERTRPLPRTGAGSHASGPRRERGVGPRDGRVSEREGLHPRHRRPGSRSLARTPAAQLLRTAPRSTRGDGPGRAERAARGASRDRTVPVPSPRPSRRAPA